ncbi:MAG TPA: hypothetical protein VH592_11325 [Gemmataceae bacterium]
MPARRTFVPQLETLEDRCVPAPMVFNGGFAEQIGSTLTVNVTAPTNTVMILEDGNGDVWAQWNAWLPNGFSGITNIQVNATGSSNTVFFYNLAPLASPQQLTLNLMAAANSVFAHVAPGGAPLSIQANPGVVVQPF